MKAVIIKIDEEGPRVIYFGLEQEMKSKMFEIMMNSEDGFRRFENDFGYCIGVTEDVYGEKKEVKYILQFIIEK